MLWLIKTTISTCSIPLRAARIVSTCRRRRPDVVVRRQRALSWGSADPYAIRASYEAVHSGSTGIGRAVQEQPRIFRGHLPLPCCARALRSQWRSWWRVPLPTLAPAAAATPVALAALRATASRSLAAVAIPPAAASPARVPAVVPVPAAVAGVRAAVAPAVPAAADASGGRGRWEAPRWNQSRRWHSEPLGPSSCPPSSPRALVTSSHSTRRRQRQGLCALSRSFSSRKNV